MVSDPASSGPEASKEYTRSGPKEPKPSTQSPRRGHAEATDRHLADLTAQRDRAEKECEEHRKEIARLNVRLTEVSIERARFEENNRHLSERLESERLERGLVGVVATVAIAIGGGFVGLVSGWKQWAMGSLLFVGCCFVLYNSLLNFGRRSSSPPSNASPPGPPAG
jgi:hypothetical protein